MVKKYKKNITIKIACISTEFLICVIPMVLIMFLFLVPERLTEFIEVIGTIFILIVVFNLFLYIISLIGKNFIKTIYLINNDELIIRRNSKNKIIDLKSVNAITYDLGELNKYGSNPFKLVLFDKNYNNLITIENPPLIMVFHIKKKCNTAKISYYNSKRIFFFLLLCSGSAVVISLIAMLAK